MSEWQQEGEWARVPCLDTQRFHCIALHCIVAHRLTAAMDTLLCVRLVDARVSDRCLTMMLTSLVEMEAKLRSKHRSRLARRHRASSPGRHGARSPAAGFVSPASYLPSPAAGTLPSPSPASLIKHPLRGLRELALSENPFAVPCMVVFAEESMWGWCGIPIVADLL